MVMHFNVLSFIAASYQLFGRGSGKYLLARRWAAGSEGCRRVSTPRIYNIATRQAVTFAPNQNSQPEAGSGIRVKNLEKKHKTSSEGETTMKLEDGEVK